MPCPTPTNGSPTYLEWPGWAFDFDGFRLLEAVDGLQVMHAVHQRLAPVRTGQLRTSRPSKHTGTHHIRGVAREQQANEAAGLQPLGALVVREEAVRFA